MANIAGELLENIIGKVTKSHGDDVGKVVGNIFEKMNYDFADNIGDDVINKLADVSKTRLGQVTKYLDKNADAVSVTGRQLRSNIDNFFVKNNMFNGRTISGNDLGGYSDWAKGFYEGLDNTNVSVIRSATVHNNAAKQAGMNFDIGNYSPIKNTVKAPEQNVRQSWFNSVNNANANVNDVASPGEVNSRINEITGWRKNEFSKNRVETGNPTVPLEEGTNQVKQAEEAMNEVKQARAEAKGNQTTNQTGHTDPTEAAKDHSQKIFDITGTKYKGTAGYAAKKDQQAANEIFEMTDTEKMRKKLGNFDFKDEDIEKYVNADKEEQMEMLKDHVGKRAGRDLTWGETMGYHKVPQKAATVGATAWLISSMSSSKGQQSNAELYGQQTPYR